MQLNNYIMKILNILLYILTIGISNYSYSQIIKPLSKFYTDDTSYNPDNIAFNPVYYKDVNNYFTPFIGDWKYQYDNKTFIVTLWKETQYPIYVDRSTNSEVLYYIDVIYGHYRLYQDYGLPTQQLIYTSEITVIYDPTNYRKTEIVSDAISPNKLSGIVLDLVNNSGYKENHGYLAMTINPTSSPLTAIWDVEMAESLEPDLPDSLNIPTNIILTKM